ncbi:MAG: ATP-binding protein, partial [Actinobacteria bacterium]|nr:ATP-binding protein [Actinomycetota bacterium]
MWNVPDRRTRVFIGRNDLLRELESSLQAESTVVLVGPDGMGKTALAVEYAYRHSADYDAVWWVRAERPETLAADYAGLAPALGLSEQTAQDQALQMDTARRWLERHGRWLLVLDNAAGVDTLRPFLPTGTGSHVLVTTQTPVARSDARTLPVGEMSRDDAITFLLQGTGSDDVASARDIADVLGDFPLALEHAAAYVEAQGTLADYLTRLRRDAKTLFSTRHPADHSATVAATWRVSCEAVRRSSGAAGDLFRLCAYLAADDIPTGTLQAHLGAIGRGRRRTTPSDQLDELLGLLEGFSLVERLPDALSVHRLVQAVVRDDLSAKDQRLWAGTAVRLMASTFPAPRDDVGHWPACERLVPHALVAAEHAERLGTELRATSRVLNGVALYLRERAQFEAARAAFE